MSVPQHHPHGVDDMPSATPSTVRTGQFISFRVGGAEYAIDILAVREIKGWTEVTALPNQPEYMLGVMNLRGAIVPVFDLRCRFRLGLTEATPTHVVIIVSIAEKTLGLLVDAISDILTLDAGEIRPVPETDEPAANDFLAGIVPVEGATVLILALEKIFAREHTRFDRAAA